jgi:hypothetical protein
MSRFERLLNKITSPNIYVRAGGALTGGGLGYTFSKASKDEKYRKYKVEVSEKLHIVPAILTGAVGAWIPLIPFLGTISLTLLYGAHKYCLWERKTLEDMKKV